jgi:hypothetical protein
MAALLRRRSRTVGLVRPGVDTLSPLLCGRGDPLSLPLFLYGLESVHLYVESALWTWGQLGDPCLISEAGLWQRERWVGTSDFYGAL